jgi:hypothetical protein
MKSSGGGNIVELIVIDSALKYIGVKIEFQQRLQISLNILEAKYFCNISLG